MDTCSVFRNGTCEEERQREIIQRYLLSGQNFVLCQKQYNHSHHTVQYGTVRYAPLWIRTRFLSFDPIANKNIFLPVFANG